MGIKGFIYVHSQHNIKIYFILDLFQIWFKLQLSKQYNAKEKTATTTTHTQKMCLERVKRSLGTNHCDVEPKYIVSVIDMVQERQASASVFLHNHHENWTIKFFNIYKNCPGLVSTFTTALQLTGELKRGCRHHHPVLWVLTELDPMDLPNPNENIIHNNNVQVRREITSVFKDGRDIQRSLPACNEMKKYTRYDMHNISSNLPRNSKENMK